jgi:predicted dehydrogenase
MKKREFLKKVAVLSTGVTILPSCGINQSEENQKNEDKNKINDLDQEVKRIRTAHIGIGGMGAEDLKAISSHDFVDVVAICDVDFVALMTAQKLHPKAQVYSDYREMFKIIGNDIDAVIVSTPDHTHAPASMMAMEFGKAVYCQKPLTHHVSEARAMQRLAKEKNLVTQMGIQVEQI